MNVIVDFVALHASFNFVNHVGFFKNRARVSVRTVDSVCM